jgi:dynein heavy chain
MQRSTVNVQVKERLVKMGVLQPLNIFLRQEIDRMRKVLSVVKSTLTDLKLAIDGTIIMNEVGLCIVCRL